jgi:hypothetical protein
VVSTDNSETARDEPIRLKAESRSTFVADQELERLAAELGPDPAAGDLDEDTERGGAPMPAPFDIGLPRPRAIDLIELWRLTGNKPDPEILAGLGPNVPVLLSHGITAFPAMGRKPARVWGLGYDCSVFDVEADTVGVTPATDMLDIAKVGADARVELHLDGRIGVPEPLAGAVSMVPGVSLTEASVETHVGEKAALFLQFRVSVPRVISGPDANGGAKWALYAQDHQIAGYQPLLQTILVPKGTKSLRVDVKSWVREAGWLGPTRNWAVKVDSFEIDLSPHRRRAPGKG